MGTHARNASPGRTISNLLNGGDLAKAALLGRNGLQISRGDLQGRVEALGGQLAAAGLNRTDRVAIVLENGPHAAVSFLGVAAAVVAAPLNPAYTQTEFEFALTDLPAAALLTDGTVAAANAAASTLRVPLLQLREDGTLSSFSAGRCPTPRPEDVALILHTSGTTGRPKRVPLTHANLTVSAMNIAEALALTSDDRCLNVMPLFHIHGLVGGLLASLAACASIVCEPGFDAFRFIPRLGETEATWYSAVPTVHQMVLGRSRDSISSSLPKLRFVRSSSSAMPRPVMDGIEALFGVPLIEAYGMTECSHQIASNPIPPGERRPGSVGLARGVDVAIVDGSGCDMGREGIGEVVIRGPSVTPGYEGLAREFFTFPGGWLRTGDQGFLDQDGYLFLTGRLKELVNRGGEKIAPREVEETLLTHPAVAEAVVFAVSHPSLGEEVGAAVVLAAGHSATPAEIRTFAARRLAAFKVPRKLVVIDKIPLGPTGKPLRLGMAERLGLE